MTGQSGCFPKSITVKIITAGTVLFHIAVSAGCSSLQAYMYVLAADYDGNAVLKKEGEVKKLLLDILGNAGEYRMKAYTRTAISFKVKKTALTTHSFYVITRAGETYQTLSFSATGKGAVSEGAWTINTDTDVSSYGEYLNGENRWRVEEIPIEREIDTLKTLSNVLEKMTSNTTYYFMAKVNAHDKRDNCNTALLETLAETQ
jgi:hypothetical protein